MLWGLWTKRRLQRTAERMRAEHERFLTIALLARREYPKIPTRRVDQGGFDRLMAREHGPRLAQRWWETALDRIDR